MARVSVKMYATVREAAGAGSCQLDADTVSDLLDALSAKFGRRMAAILDLADRDPDRLVILLNGKNISHGRALELRLSEGDEVALFPPVSGG